MEDPSIEAELIKFNVAFNKQNYPLEFDLNSTIGKLKEEVAKQTGIPPALQKMIYKGLCKNDEQTLKDKGFKDGVKVMLSGSTIQQVLVATEAPPPTSENNVLGFNAPVIQEPLSTKPQHKKVLDKGIPAECEKGDKTRHLSIPENPLSGIYNNSGAKIRLTFKVYTQELWISSASSTQKMNFGQIQNIKTEAIVGNEDYHIMSLQLGSTEATTNNLLIFTNFMVFNKTKRYYVPAQYTRAIRNTIMGD